MDKKELKNLLLQKEKEYLSELVLTLLYRLEEHCAQMVQTEVWIESPPRVRGTLCSGHYRPFALGIIPACAGNTGTTIIQ